MPITATPVLLSTLSPSTPVAADCYNQNVIAAPVSQVNGRYVLSRMRAVRVGGGQKPVIRWTMLNQQGEPVSLDDCGLSPGSESSAGSGVVGVIGTPIHAEVAVKLRLRDQLSIGNANLPTQYEYVAEVVDSENGIVEVQLPRESTTVPGVYFAEMAVVGTDDDGKEYVHFSNTFYVIIEQGHWSAKRGLSGPPTLAEIRLHLRDSSAEENFLLDTVKFDDAEIALAIARPIQYWNEIPPDLGVRYTTQNFPWRYHWLEAICANLFWMAAENFRSNNLTYSAAGVQVNDQDKEPNYERAADRRNANWLEFVKRKKSEINLNSAFGGIGSSYRYSTGYGNGTY